MNIEQRLTKIEKRNKKVEQDKAWETSFTRKIILAILTYFVVSIVFIIINVKQPLLNALIPTIAFMISNLSLKVFKKIWLIIKK